MFLSLIINLFLGLAKIMGLLVNYEITIYIYIYIYYFVNKSLLPNAVELMTILQLCGNFDNVNIVKLILYNGL